MESNWNEITGDLIKEAKAGKFDLITHGCNCRKNFGAGIALAFKHKYPLSYETDIHTSSPFGGISVCNEYNEVIIVNSYTQRNPGIGYGNDSEFHRYDAIRSCMKEINQKYKGKHIGLPLIGCGLAGLKWNKVKKILKEELSDMNVTIVHYGK